MDSQSQAQAHKEKAIATRVSLVLAHPERYSEDELAWAKAKATELAVESPVEMKSEEA
jgi:hypothetical protein